MALGTLSGFLTRQQITGTDAARDAAISQALAEAADAVKALCFPTMLEPGTATGHVVDAPWNSQFLWTPLRPVRSLTAVRVQPTAKGNPALFTTDTLKTAFTDYRLVVNKYPEGWSSHGKVQVLNASCWGSALVRYYQRLGLDVTDAPGAVQLDYAYGYDVIPTRVETAVYTAAAMLLARRKTGAPVTSASLNGASYGSAAPFTATAAVQSPDVIAHLYGLYDPVKFGGL